MADIQILPTKGLGSAQMAHLIADLEEVARMGTDLGSRVPHIQGAGEELRQLTKQLIEKISELQQIRSQFGLQDLNKDADADLGHLVCKVTALADYAKNFSIGLVDSHEDLGA